MTSSADEGPAPRPRDSRRLRLAIALGVAAILAVVIGLYARARGGENHEAVAALPKRVTVVKAVAASWRPSRTYVGTLAPWTAARVGPQYVSAYVGSVLVRPGATVHAGQVLATLDCRGSSATSKAIAARARALEERQRAAEHEAERVRQLIDGGFASANEAEQLTARSRADLAEVDSLRASLTSRNLEVDDCVLRAPFAGEIADRFADPGAYVRPGNPVVSVIDRATVRVVADVPESDFPVVAPGVEVTIDSAALGRTLRGRVARRAPAADDATRTVRCEIDLANADRALPVGTTVRVTVAVGAPTAATRVPLRSAVVRGDKATVFVVRDGTAAHVAEPVLGESGGDLFLATTLAAGSPVVLEGRALLDDGDRVTATEATP